MGKFIDKKGETAVANNGQTMTIIAYRKHDDIDVQFEDGTIVTNRSYRYFKKRNIVNPNYDKYKNRKGETIVAKNGQTMTIIAYRGACNIDVQFEDGTIVKNKEYKSFKKGQIKNPNYSRKGETIVAKNGQIMTIIAYRKAHDIDVQFEDGTIVKNRQYDDFKTRGIENPNYDKYKNRKGETAITTKGQTMTIIAYRGCNDIDVQFEDGTIVTNKTYTRFKKGYIKNPNYGEGINNHETGETIIANNGQIMTLIKYRNYKDIDVQFEDGTIVTNKTYGNFKKGNIRNPKLYPVNSTNQSKNKKGETKIASNGLKMVIIEYHNGSNIDIQFEDGTIIKHKEYKSFKKGEIKHPNIIKFRNKRELHDKPVGHLYNTDLYGIAYEHQNTTFYYTFCPVCQESDIMSFEQIKHHKCNLDHPDQKLLKELHPTLAVKHKVTP